MSVGHRYQYANCSTLSSYGKGRTVLHCRSRIKEIIMKKSLSVLVCLSSAAALLVVASVADAQVRIGGGRGGIGIGRPYGGYYGGGYGYSGYGYGPGYYGLGPGVGAQLGNPGYYGYGNGIRYGTGYYGQP